MNGLIVDNFAGGGGASLGIELALGRSVDIAINHDPAAVEMHRANHPHTRHLCEDIYAVDPVEATGGRPVDLLWASPDCKHFSKAKGGKPVSRRVRGLAWVVIRWARVKRPRIIFLENVEEFQTWGPLGPDDRPDKARAGLTFRRWVGQLRTLGYAVEWRELRACDYGVPTIRKRLYLIARCDGLPIVWPERTHGHLYDTQNRYRSRTRSRGTDPGLWDAQAPEQRARSVRGNSGGGGGVLGGGHEEARGTMRGCPRNRIDTGSGYGDAGARRFESLKPYRTAAECIDWSLPCPSIFERRRPLAENTLRRIAAGIRRYVIEAAEPFIVTCNHGGPEARCASAADPLSTVTAARDARGIVIPTVTRIGQTSGRGRYYQFPAEALTTVTTKAEHLLVSPYLTPRYGERDGQALRCRGVDVPLPTVTPTANGASLVSAFLAKHFGGHETSGAGAREPLSTVTARDHHALAAAHLVKLRGTCADGQPVTEPMPTVTAGGNHVAEVRAFLLKYYGTKRDGCSAAEPLHTATDRARFGLVTVAGVDYQIVDIGMRMLTPRELARAQGFPDSYVLTGSKSSQVARIGNSVCPGMAEALVRANATWGEEREAV
jgi:DNA (cytosine-5)-methyltransferase 1